MASIFNSPLSLGSLTLANRLIQGPLAGFSCSPFRALFSQFSLPAYCVSEMISAHDIIHKHSLHSRYLHRANHEKLLCYQIAGDQPNIMAQAALRLEMIGADLIDINCGCPKTKIRKKGAGSALLENPLQLLSIISAVRKTIKIPLTVKLRIQNNELDFTLAKMIEDAGVDALIIHGRHWTADYNQPNNLDRIAAIKRRITIPIIANGDITDYTSLHNAHTQTGCDAFMISRAGTGKPWLYKTLLDETPVTINNQELLVLFMQHLQDLAKLENDYKALLQSKSLVRYYFRKQFDANQLQTFYQMDKLENLEAWLTRQLN